MTDNLKFKTLQEITDDIKLKVDHLLTGDLSKSELEHLTEASRELFERLVVLRYKAYDSEVKSETIAEEQDSSPVVAEPEVTEMPAISFRIDEAKIDQPVQVSLIDAIEEVTKTEIPVIEKEEPVVIPMTPETTRPAAVTNTQYAVEQKESVYDRLSKTISATESIAQKLEHNPISDLKRAITLNQRFQFSRELFKGNNQDYEVAIDKLNNTTREDAMQQIASLKNKYAWSDESPVTTDFVGLVERRYQM